MIESRMIARPPEAKQTWFSRGRSIRRRTLAMSAAAIAIAMSFACVGCTQNAASQWAQTSAIIKSSPIDDQTVRLGTRGL